MATPLTGRWDRGSDPANCFLTTVSNVVHHPPEPWSSDTVVYRPADPAQQPPAPDAACTLVIFGASGDLTRRLVMPALYNLACDRLLPTPFTVVGVARDELSDDEFRGRLTSAVQHFNTRASFEPAIWDPLAVRMHYTAGDFEAPATYTQLGKLLTRLQSQDGAGRNLLFYLATPPAAFGPISAQLGAAGLCRREGVWTRLIIEKPFGHDLASAAALSRELLAHWREEQLYRIDHYLGKETVQNLLAFRFANGAFEALWNRAHIDHIQLTVAETVGVEGRGGYYDRTGVLRDMIQNHLLQMLAYVCMEPPPSFTADAVRNEKARLLAAVRPFTPTDLEQHVVRGQYGPGQKPDGTPVAGYRQEPAVALDSATETFAALRLSIENARWQGVPIYLRSGKALWKRGTEIVVEFKRAAAGPFDAVSAGAQLEANRLIFHIQPDQGIEFRFHAKAPGPKLNLQKVNMRFDYQETFQAARGTGYEVLLHNAMAGDATLFSRTDLVETAWHIVQPILDAWATDAPADFPNYTAGSWGPRAAYELLERDGRCWVEIVNRTVLERVPLFRGADPLFLRNLALMLRPAVAMAGADIVQRGAPGGAMYFICHGQAHALDGGGAVLNVLDAGGFFGELSLLLNRPRTATVRAVTTCDLFMLERSDLEKVLREHPDLGDVLQANACSRYRLD
jgi:glucose-6-phosphate 1-dehydrogenase